MAVSFSLRDAVIARDEQIEAAQAEFERACEKAAAVANQRKRAALRVYEANRSQAHKVAVLRARLWREHQALSDQELLLRLQIHRTRMSTDYPGSTSAARADEEWYIRLIRSLLIRRRVLSDKDLLARRAADMEYGQRKIETALRFRAAS